MKLNLASTIYLPDISVFRTEISDKYIVLVLISLLFYLFSSLRRGDQSTVFLHSTLWFTPAQLGALLSRLVKKYLVASRRAVVDGLIDNDDEKVASSKKKHTNFKTRMQNQCKIDTQFNLWLELLKPHLLQPHHTREYLSRRTLHQNQLTFTKLYTAC